MTVRQIRNYRKVRQTGHVFDGPWPSFYAVQTVPDYLPGRIKFGYSKNPQERLAHYLTGSPKAEIFFIDNCPGGTLQEASAIKVLALLCRCQHVGSEVFDFADLQDLERKLRYVFDGSAVFSPTCADCGFPLLEPEFCPKDLRERIPEIRDWQPTRKFDPGVCWRCAWWRTLPAFVRRASRAKLAAISLEEVQRGAVDLLGRHRARKE